MTSVPVLARGFAAQECRRRLREAAAQGADVRPHFFPQVSTRSPSRRADGDFTCPAAYPPCALATGAGGDAAARVYTWAHVCLYVGDLAAQEGWNSWKTASRVTGQRLGTSGRLSVCLPLVVCFSIRLSPPSPCVSVSTCLSLSVSVFLFLSLSLFSPSLSPPPSLSPTLPSSLPPSLMSFQPFLPASMRGNAEPGETAPGGPPRKELGWAVFQYRQGCHGNPGAQHLPHPGRAGSQHRKQ